ncbi:sugar phosphate isomerase/epimerase family protein [Niabella yanshanensis]|uniref:Sugar phosphate isomerase/epimerase family protein n=1 Tax=Niabella yanshanensis TaxID=577386 RepID=A0ABZ0W971_9BACT|nr:sugar phosphate isomerase/epimerase family protein [Niabella yanshanensis]WQD39504.1 sugar phosphate isomerase/epimerase family protein [Niabella yanshanensis]
MTKKIACFIASLLASPLCMFAQDVPLLGVCANLDKAPVVKKYNYAFLQPTVGDALQPLQADSVFNSGEKIKKSGARVLAANVFIPGSIKTTGPEVNEKKILAYATTVFERAQSQGIPIIVFGSGASRMIPGGFPRDSAFKQFVSIGKKLAPLAARYNIVLALESQNKEECNFLNTVKECIDVAKAVNHSNYKICVDIYHMMRENEPVSVITEGGSLIYHCDIGEKATRSAPGIAGDDFTPYFKAFQQIGYKGMIALECRFTDLDKELPIAAKTIREQWQKALKQIPKNL